MSTRECGVAGVYFGQLLGMADHLTFPLGRHGYRAHKILPYGPVEETLQYLLRRAQVLWLCWSPRPSLRHEINAPVPLIFCIKISHWHIPNSKSFDSAQCTSGVSSALFTRF